MNTKLNRRNETPSFITKEQKLQAILLEMKSRGLATIGHEVLLKQLTCSTTANLDYSSTPTWKLPALMHLNCEIHQEKFLVRVNMLVEKVKRNYEQSAIISQQEWLETQSILGVDFNDLDTYKTIVKSKTNLETV